MNCLKGIATVILRNKKEALKRNLRPGVDKLNTNLSTFPGTNQSEFIVLAPNTLQNLGQWFGGYEFFHNYPRQQSDRHRIG